jgi:hypothetical protein
LIFPEVNMKKFLLSTAVVLAFTAAGGAAYKAAADTGPPPPPPGFAPPPGQWNGPGRGPWAGGPGHSWGPWGPGGKGQGGGAGRDRKFSLFAPTQNKNLSSADVKTIATAILLEHGNHDWGVSNIVTEQDKSIQFSFTTRHGDLIATFAIDPASGRIKRVS